MAGNTRGSAASDEPLRKRGCLGLRKRGFGLHPEGFAPGKSGGLGQQRFYLMNLAAFCNFLNNYGGEKKKKKERKKETQVQQQPSPAGTGGCSRAAAPDTRGCVYMPALLRLQPYHVHSSGAAPELYITLFRSSFLRIKR